jgi:hypothetical protein
MTLMCAGPLQLLCMDTARQPFHTCRTWQQVVTAVTMTMAMSMTMARAVTTTAMTMAHAAMTTGMTMAHVATTIAMTMVTITTTITTTTTQSPPCCLPFSRLQGGCCSHTSSQ